MNPISPSRDDSATIACPVCERPFVPLGRRLYCSEACKHTAYRRRHQAGIGTVVVSSPRPRRPITVYECPSCGARALGEQRCGECGSFMSRVGLGGLCPHCDDPVSVSDLFDGEVNAEGG